jgi:uncharacterized membrane protein
MAIRSCDQTHEQNNSVVFKVEFLAVDVAEVVSIRRCMRDRCNLRFVVVCVVWVLVEVVVAVVFVVAVALFSEISSKIKMVMFVFFYTTQGPAIQIVVPMSFIN